MRILMRQGNGEWSTIEPDPYPYERDLQSLLLSSPGLIPNDSTAGDVAMAWCREYPSATGPIDLVGVGNTGSITVMECKLARNAEVKRKVVGQVLDYAAALWQSAVTDFEAHFARVDTRFGDGSGGFVDQLARQTGDLGFTLDYAELRANVAQRLADGRFRLVIAVDEVDPDLKRIIEYVNDRGRGSPLKLVALAFPRYRSGDVEVLMPETFGDELAAVPAGTEGTWDEKSVLDSMDPRDATVASHLLIWARSRSLRVRWGTGAKHGSYLVERPTETVDYQLFNVQGNGRVWLPFKSLARGPALAERSARARLLEALPAFEPAWTEDVLDRFPNAPLAQLRDPAALKRFLAAMDGALGLIDARHRTAGDD